jgi:hypothetical protein
MGTSPISDATQYPQDNGLTCQDLLLGYCVGETVDGQALADWKAEWAVGGVVNRVINWNVYRNPRQLPIPNNEQGLLWCQKLAALALNKYQSEGYVIGVGVGMPGYHVFEQYFYVYATTIPGFADPALLSLCTAQSTQGLLDSPGLIPWCGCFLPDSQYQEWTKLYQVSKACAPVCARQGNIRPGNPSNTGFDTCLDSMCIMDDITVQLANVDAGNLSFTQVCGGCTTANVTATATSETSVTSSCHCVIQNDTINIMNARLGDIGLSQSCRNATCYGKDKDGQQIPVDCASGKALSETEKAGPTTDNGPRNLMMIIYSVVALVIILFLIFFFR